MQIYSTQIEITRLWPFAVLFIGLLCLYIRKYYMKYNKKYRLQFITRLQFFSLRSSIYLRILYRLFFIILLLAFALLIFSAAQPKVSYIRKVQDDSNVYNLLLVDISPSMSVKDIDNLSRWDAVKDATLLFLDEDMNANISLVVFSDLIATVAPFTPDYSFIKKALHNIKLGQLGEGTALSDAIIFASKLLSEVSSDKKNLILISDGFQNSGRNTMKSAEEVINSSAFNFQIIHIGTDKLSDFVYTSPNSSVTHIGNVEPSKENIFLPFSQKTKSDYKRVRSEIDLQTFFFDVYRSMTDLSAFTIVEEYRDISAMVFFFAIALLGLATCIRFMVLKTI